MNWKKFMTETEANIATFSKEIPQDSKSTLQPWEQPQKLNGL